MLDPAPDFSVETVILIVCAVLFLIVVVFGAVLTAILVPILKGQPEIVKASIRAGYETGVKQATDIVEKTPSPVDNLLLEEINKVVRNMLTEAGILPQKSPVDGAP